jgi:hypothetical protein
VNVVSVFRPQRVRVCSPNTNECSAPGTPFVWAFIVSDFV